MAMEGLLSNKGSPSSLPPSLPPSFLPSLVLIHPYISLNRDLSESLSVCLCPPASVCVVAWLSCQRGVGGGWAMIAEPTTTCCCVRCVSMCVCVCTRLYGGCLSFFSSQRDCHEGQTHHTNTNTHARTHARGREGREGGREGGRRDGRLWQARPGRSGK